MHRAIAREVQRDKHQDQYDGGDTECRHPAGCCRRRTPACRVALQPRHRLGRITRLLLAHRRSVYRYMSQNGLRSVTISQIAKETGIGRATLCKYFPDVEAILVAWHD